MDELGSLQRGICLIFLALATTTLLLGSRRYYETEGVGKNKANFFRKNAVYMYIYVRSILRNRTVTWMKRFLMKKKKKTKIQNKFSSRFSGKIGLKNSKINLLFFNLGQSLKPYVFYHKLYYVKKVKNNRIHTHKVH